MEGRLEIQKLTGILELFPALALWTKREKSKPRDAQEKVSPQQTRAPLRVTAQ